MWAAEGSSFRRHLVIYLANFLLPCPWCKCPQQGNRKINSAPEIPEWSRCHRKKQKKNKTKSGMSQPYWRLSFQFSCHLYSPIRIYLTPHQKMSLNPFYQSWQRQTMLCNNSRQSLGCECVDLYSCYCSRTVLVCRRSVLIPSVALTCWSSSTLNIYYVQYTG